MRIDSGTTNEHRIRLGIFLLMCVVFALYFGYDGMWGYPRKNLEWARQNLQGVPQEEREKVQTNPKVMLAELKRIQDQTQQPGGITLEQVKSTLGEPAAVSEDKDRGGQNYWYVGPASCARLHVLGGKVREVFPFENVVKSENDIKMQKVFGMGLGVIAILVGLYYLRIMTMRTVLDDTGLNVKGRRQITWDQMTGLGTSDYARKGWLDMEYSVDGESRTVRLDSYHIEKFDEVVIAICERKGFANPIKPKSDEGTDGEPA